MMSARLERLFDRYRRKGDPKSLAKVFDATAPALWRVALHLSHSQERAEDLLQETFLAAIEKAQSFDETRPLVPWLMGLLSVQARRAKREEGRRPDPRRLGGRAVDAADTPDSAAARRELEEAVRKAMAELPEPYRQVLCMHLQEDLAPIQVARRLGRGGNTVRTQIRRGLAMLREGLPAGMAPALVPLAGLPRIREVVLAKAAETAAQTAAETAVVSMLAGTKTSVLSALMGEMAMKKAVVVFAGVLLIGAGAFSFWGLFDQDLATPQDGEAPGVVSRQDGSPAVPDSERSPGTRQALAKRGSRDTERRAASARRNPAFAGLPEKATCRIQVVEKGTGKPVPGARVAWCVQYGQDELSAQLYTGLETQHERIMRDGRGLVADAEGFVELPCVPWACHVHGEHADRIGSIYLTKGTRPPYRLVLEPTRQVEIQVVDGSGQPVVGVPVNVVALARDDRRTIWRGATAGDEGIAKARFPAVRTLAPGKETLFASLHAPFDPGLRKPLPEAAAAEPVRLTLPRTGGISVAVQDANGRPVPDGCIVSIQRPHVGKDVDGLYTSVRVSRPVEEGRARFLFFPLAQEFYATAKPLDPSVGRFTTQGAHALFDGPTAPGQQVAITLQLGAPHPALRGRVLDEHGKPLAEALLISKFLRAEGLAGGPPAGFGRLMKTDAEGRFTWLSNPWIDVRTATRLEVELIHWCSTGAGGDPRGPRGAFVAAGPLPPQGLDVGVVRLGSKPLLLTGSVRDARGNPIPKARIIVDGLTPTPKGERWKQLGDFRCQDDGNFSFSGSAPERLRVRCIARGYFAAPYRECQPGDRNIEFVLKPWCVVNGRFLLDPGLPTEDLEAAVGDLWSHVDKDGSFQIIALQPGVHAVDLKMMDRVMHRVEGVSVRPEEPTKLPPIDLRGRLRVLRLQVLDKDGKPPFVIRIADASAGGELLFEESVVMKGRIAIPVPVSVQRFAVSAQECRPVLVSWRKKEQKVVLGAGLRVKIRWQAPVPKPGFETDTLQELAFHLQPVANGKTPVWAALWQPYPEIMPWGQASGEQELMLPRPGFYRVVWRATPKGCYEPIVITRTATVEVKDQVAEQLLTVSLSPEVAQAFLAKRKQK